MRSNSLVPTRCIWKPSTRLLYHSCEDLDIIFCELIPEQPKVNKKRPYSAKREKSTQFQQVTRVDRMYVIIAIRTKISNVHIKNNEKYNHPISLLKDKMRRSTKRTKPSVRSTRENTLAQHQEAN